MDATTDLAAARLSRFLEEEPVLWLSTVGEDGAPHLVPTWFAWDGTTIVIVSKPGARKARNIAADPRVMLALGDAEDDFDVGMLEAVGTLEDGPTPMTLPDGFAAKYGSRIAALGLTVEQFARIYSRTIRLTPVKALGWHGRSTPASVVAAARQVAAARPTSLAEPRTLSSVVQSWLGEPLSRGLRGLAGPLRPESAPGV